MISGRMSHLNTTTEKPSHDLDRIYSGGSTSIRGYERGSIFGDGFVEGGLSLLGPMYALFRPFVFLNYGSQLEQLRTLQYGYGTYGIGIAVGLGMVRGDVVYCMPLHGDRIEQRIHVGLGMEML